jgi:DegV family protein with EDD domain
MRIRVTSDSTCDLSPELIEQFHIGISPLYVVLDGKSYKDTVEITPDDIYAYVAKTKRVGSTAALNVSDYLDFFKAQKEGYDAIVHFTISSEMSSCYQNACLAAEEIGDVYVIDSRNLSTGIGHLALTGVELAREGKGGAEIQRILNEKREKLDVSFVLDTLYYLHKGGRCSGVAALGANLLNLKPCIEVRGGKMGVGKKYRGNLQKCMIAYVYDRLANRDDLDYKRIFITHTRLKPGVFEAVKEAVAATGPWEEILETYAGCTISNHCGPGCLGVLYYHK